MGRRVRSLALSSSFGWAERIIRSSLLEWNSLHATIHDLRYSMAGATTSPPTGMLYACDLLLERGKLVRINTSVAGEGRGDLHLACRLPTGESGGGS